MRAIETGRWVAQVAPTGFTAVIDDHGNVVERSRISETRVIQRTMELREGLTIYTRVGNLPGVVAAVALVAAGWLVERRRARPAYGVGVRASKAASETGSPVRAT
jgi:apolipoprotein N-acyltransferase